MFLLFTLSAWADSPAEPAPDAVSGSFSINRSNCDPPPQVGAPRAGAFARSIAWDPDRGGWTVDGVLVPIVGRPGVLESLGTRTGPDGQQWLAGGPVTVAIDGFALGEGMGGPMVGAQPVARHGLVGLPPIFR